MCVLLAEPQIDDNEHLLIVIMSPTTDQSGVNYTNTHPFVSIEPHGCLYTVYSILYGVVDTMVKVNPSGYGNYSLQFTY